MIPHPVHYAEALTTQCVDRILDQAFQVLERIGLDVQSPMVIAEIRDRASALDVRENRIRFPRSLVERALESIPTRFVLHGRNGGQHVPIGERVLAVSPGYGSAVIADHTGAQREATLDDLRGFLALCEALDIVSVCGTLTVEPQDVAPRTRPLVLAREVLEHTTKPFFASVAGRDAARDALDLMEIACDGLERPVAIGLINVDSPLRLNREMAEAMWEYVTRAQPVVFTPGILCGATAPVTVTGGLVQGFAELLGCATVAQILHPGAPVVCGLGGFGSDLRMVSPGFGRPENASAVYAGAQIARRLGVPFRCSASATGSCFPGFRAGQESMMTASAAWSAGAHLTMQALGILDHINAMSFEKFVLDAEGWRKLRHIAGTTGEADDVDYSAMIAEAAGEYLTADHTVEHLHTAQHEALVREPDSCGGATGTQAEAVALAAEYCRRMRETPREPVLGKVVRRELDRLVAARLGELGEDRA